MFFILRIFFVLIARTGTVPLLFQHIYLGTAFCQTAVAIGYIGIVYVMFSGARRLEIRQNGAYGKDPEYQEYIKKTPILLPFVPIYSVEKHKWLQA